VHKENELGFVGAVVAAAVAGGSSSQVLPLGDSGSYNIRVGKKTGRRN
jgi:hypothetical protein